MTPSPIRLQALYRFKVHYQRSLALRPGAWLRLTSASWFPQGPVTCFRSTAFLASLTAAPHYNERLEAGTSLPMPGRHGPWHTATLRPASFLPIAPDSLLTQLHAVLAPTGLGPVSDNVRDATEGLFSHLTLSVTHAWLLAAPPTSADPAIGAWSELVLMNADNRWLTQATFYREAGSP